MGDPDEIYPYYTENGQIYGVICRFNTSKGKEIRPLTWRRWERGPLKGQGMWRYKGFGERRPLFNLPAILSTHHSIVLCEGEKAAVAAEQLFDDFIGTCWSGGVNAYHKTNFSHLKDRTVFLWPDFDSQGVAAMMHVGEILKKNNCKIRFIIPPRDTKKGSDAADLLLVGMVPREALEEAVVALEAQKRACAELGAQLSDSQRAQRELGENNA